MNGFVDDSLRALVDVSVSPTPVANRKPLRVWVDTAFNGGLVIPRKYIYRLGLTQSATIEAILADGREFDLESFNCYLDWFGNVYETQIVPTMAYILCSAPNCWPIEY